MPTQRIVKNPIISKDAYTTLVTFFFSAAIVTWGTLIIGYVPFTTDKIEWIWKEPPLAIYGGFLYGGVLICVFWIYIEKIGSVEKERPGVIAPFDYAGYKGDLAKGLHNSTLLKSCRLFSWLIASVSTPITCKYVAYLSVCGNNVKKIPALKLFLN